MPHSAKLNESVKLCSHLDTCYKNIDCITTHFPDYFNESNVVNDDNENANIQEDVNMEDDDTLSSDLVSNFNKETGLWSYKCLSNYKPMLSDNKYLHLFTHEWIKYIVNYNLNEIIEVMHPITNLDGTPLLCECGLMYTQESRFEEDTCNLYTHIGVAHIKCYGLKCNMNKCQKKFSDMSGMWGIFFYTNTTCAGDEIGWDFIHVVKTSKISFTGFCNEMTRVYKTTHSNAQAFMSVKTFIGCFFGWLSAFKIDFCKEIDPFCRHNPKICDTEDQQIPWPHGHVTRCLFRDEDTHTHIKYMSLKAMDKLTDKTLIPL